jgi:FMN phosphatase YigB (HAD superfamily)
MIIAIDCDDTLVDSGVALYEFYRTTINSNADVNPHSWSSKWPVWGNDENKMVRWKEFFNAWIDSEYFIKSKPINGVQETLLKLKKDGHKLFVVSAARKDPIVQARRKEFLESLYGKDIFEDVFTVASGSEKLDKIIEFGGTVLIDDDPKNLIGPIDSGMVGISIKFPSNLEPLTEFAAESKDYYNKIIIADNWSQIPEIIKSSKQ